MAIFDLLKSAKMNRDPYPWAYLPKCLEPEFAKQLAETFPTGGFNHSTKSAPDKQYSHNSRPLIRLGIDEIVDLDALSSSWQLLATFVASREYRDLISDMSQQNVHKMRQEATFWRYGKSDWLGPHLDKSEKKVTQLIYFNDYWESEWGGHLRILSSNNNNDLVERIPPTLGGAAFLLRTENSWHAVEPVAPGATSDRLSLQVVFYQ